MLPHPRISEGEIRGSGLPAAPLPADGLRPLKGEAVLGCNDMLARF